MTKLEYKLSFPRSDLVGDITERLESVLPGTPYETRRALAEQSVYNLQRQGNSVLYQGLIAGCIGEICPQKK